MPDNLGRHFVVAFAIAAFIALMGATAGAACVPATTKLAAPFICPKETDRYVIVRRVTSSGPGKTSVSSDLWCAFPTKDRYPEEASEFLLLAVLFGEYLVAAAVLSLLTALMTAPRRAPDLR